LISTFLIFYITDDTFNERGSIINGFREVEERSNDRGLIKHVPIAR